jgi:hypothetical protein
MYQINYNQKAEDAIEREETARRLWNFLEKNPKADQADICRNIDASLATIVEIIEIWDELAIVNRPLDPLQAKAECLCYRFLAVL